MKKVTTHVLYPCQWDDLFLEDGTFLATIYTLKEVKRDEFQDFEKPGIYKNKDGWDIVLNVSELTPEIVQKALDKLSEKTGEKYKFEPNEKP